MRSLFQAGGFLVGLIAAGNVLVGACQAQELTLQQVVASDASPGSWFGQAVAVHENTLMVGAPLSSGPVTVEDGAVYVFEFHDGEGWVETQKLQSSTGAEGAHFGWSVAMSDSLAVVGAPGAMNSAGTRTGAAYVYAQQKNGQWEETARLSPLNEADSTLFGVSVSVATAGTFFGEAGGNRTPFGPVVLVGAPSDVDSKGSRSGGAYFFEPDAQDVWQERRVDAPWAASGDQFGFSVGVCGNLGIVGAPSAPRESDRSGRVQAFERSDAGWLPLAEVWPFRDTQVQRVKETRSFGYAVTCGPIVAAPLEGASDEAGGVFRLDWNGAWTLSSDYGDTPDSLSRLYPIGLAEKDGWLLTGRTSSLQDEDAEGVVEVRRVGAGFRYWPWTVLRSPGSEKGDGFGLAVAAAERAFAVGAPRNCGSGPESGAVYVYRVAESTGSTLPSTPSGLTLRPAYPNPTDATVHIEFELPAPGEVLLQVFDLLGREQRRVNLGRRHRGAQGFALDVSSLPSGTYYYALTWFDQRATGTLVLIR